MTIAVIHGGGRPNGNTEILTKKVIKDISVDEIYLKKYAIDPIVDQRHAEGGFAEVNDDYNTIIDRILKHEVLIFSTPIYWYSMTGTMKNFIERFSQTLKDEKYPDFKEKMAQKKAYVVAVGGDNPYMKGLPLIQQFQYIFDFIGEVQFEGYIIGEANQPGAIYQDQRALFAAKQLRDTLQTYS